MGTRHIVQFIGIIAVLQAGIYIFMQLEKAKIKLGQSKIYPKNNIRYVNLSALKNTYSAILKFVINCLKKLPATYILWKNVPILSKAMAVQRSKKMNYVRL